MAITIPVSRSRALTRAIIWFVPTALCAVLTYAIYSRLNFIPSAISNRLVDYGLAILSLPVPVIGVIFAVRTVRWLLLAAWPKPVLILATDEKLAFHLGPFGNREFDAARLTIRYPYELLEDSDEDPGFEGYLPEEDQHEKLLPRITYPGHAKTLDQLIASFSSLAEAATIAALRPAIDRWRSALRP